MVARVIKTEADYKATLDRIDALMDARPGTARGDELELLATLVEMYEESHFPIGLPSPLEAIRFRMEQAGLGARDLVPYLGTRSRVSEVLSGRRPLSLRMIRRLHRGLGIPAEVLLQEVARPLPNGKPSAPRRRERRTSASFRNTPVEKLVGS